MKRKTKKVIPTDSTIDMPTFQPGSVKSNELSPDTTSVQRGNGAHSSTNRRYPLASRQEGAITVAVNAPIPGYDTNFDNHKLIVHQPFSQDIKDWDFRSNPKSSFSNPTVTDFPIHICHPGADITCHQYLHGISGESSAGVDNFQTPLWTYQALEASPTTRSASSLVQNARVITSSAQTSNESRKLSDSSQSLLVPASQQIATIYPSNEYHGFRNIDAGLRHHSEVSSSPSHYTISSPGSSCEHSNSASCTCPITEFKFPTEQRLLVLQPSSKHNLFQRGTLTGAIESTLESSQTGKTNAFRGYSQQGNYTSFAFRHTKPPIDIRYEDYSEENKMSDLAILARSWTQSHISNPGDVLRHLPLEELGKQLVLLNCSDLEIPGNSFFWSTVKIENIPYNLDDDMLFEFLGKNSGLLPAEMGGIHIIMDRTTGKTMDCFLEFPSAALAERFLQRRCGNNRRCILGGRHISLDFVKRGELMKWLFPKTKGCTWDEDGILMMQPSGGNPLELEIVSKEELVMILGHARTPHRSPFSRKCLQRPYESMMSIITKFPWKETDKYTLKQRDMIFQAAYEAGELLKRQLLRGKTGPNIDLRLLKRVCRTISFCPGFTYRQKLTFLDAMGITTTECFHVLGDLGISHPLATQFQALTVRPGADYIQVEAIANIIASGISQQNNNLDTSGAMEGRQFAKFITTAPGNYQMTEVAEDSSQYNDDKEETRSKLTMRKAAEIELARVNAAVMRAFDVKLGQPL